MVGPLCVLLTRRCGRPEDVLPVCCVIIVVIRDVRLLYARTLHGIEQDVTFLEPLGWRRELYSLQRPASSSLSSGSNDPTTKCRAKP